jgi:hypothetical protein
MMNQESTPTDAVFISFDLESSLGKIDDIEMMTGDDMECDPVPRPRTTRTRQQFSSDEFSVPTNTNYKKEQHVISPYPLSQTEMELNERERLTQSAGVHDWSNIAKAEKRSQDVELDLIPDDRDCDDDFSLTSHEAGSLVEEELNFDNITDAASFWEDGVDNANSTAAGGVVSVSTGEGSLRDIFA